jgi:hypothetical protein
MSTAVLIFGSTFSFSPALILSKWRLVELEAGNISETIRKGLGLRAGSIAVLLRGCSNDKPDKLPLDS